MSLFRFGRQPRWVVRQRRWLSRKKRHDIQPVLERLEDRTAPATNTWTGAADHATWNLAGNWTGGIPAPGQDVVIPATGVNGTTAVTLSGASANSIDSLTSALPINVQGTILACTGGGTPTTGGLTLTGGAAVTLKGGGIVDFQSTSQTLGGDGTGAIVFGDTSPFNEIAVSAGLQLSSGSTVTVQNGTSTTLDGTITNQGTIALDSTGDPTILEVATALTGGGSVIMSNSSNNHITGALLINVDNTIEGAGQIGQLSIMDLRIPISVFPPAAKRPRSAPSPPPRHWPGAGRPG